MIKYFFITFILWLSLALNVTAKTTYLPIYRSLITLTEPSGNTLNEESHAMITTIMPENKHFRLSVVHEEMTELKVKSIKKAKRAAGWMAASAILSSVSAFTSGSAAGFDGRIANARISSMMAGMYAANAKAEQVLHVQIQFENLGNEEMMVADIERGLVWYIRPGTNFVMDLPNPDAAQLRISPALNIGKDIYYATVCGGSSIRKWAVEYEDDDCWVVTSLENSNDYDLYFLKDNEYIRIDKDSFEERVITHKELKTIKK